MSTLEFWLRLWHIPGVGPKTFNKIIELFKSPKAVFDESYSSLLNLGFSHQQAKAIVGEHQENYIADIEWMESSSLNNIITIDSPLYPKALRHISIPPPLLYVSGDVACLNIPQQISIVGSRKATRTAQNQAYEFSKRLASIGFVVVSGLARGIDYQAHQGAVSIETGKSIAVLANGLDITYPRQHEELAYKIRRQGIIVSEFPPGTKPLPKHFPRRNRIISGFSQGVIIIEAAEKSGTLITAKYALEQGREVFAVPGQISNPLNKGCHQLIQEGATLITSIEDVLMELGGSLINQLATPNNKEKDRRLAKELEQLLALIDYCPMQIETIIAKSGLTPEQVSSMLMELEIGGYVVSDAFGQYSRSAAEII